MNIPSSESGCQGRDIRAEPDPCLHVWSCSLQQKKQERRETEGEREWGKKRKNQVESKEYVSHLLLSRHQELTELSDFFHNLTGTRARLYANGLRLWKWCQNSGKQSHPLITIPGMELQKA